MTRNIPLLVTSTDPDIRHRARTEVASSGEHKILAKPMDREVLLQAVEQLIGKA